MNIAVLGAGGIGCYYGARLQAAGHEVIFIARGDHQQALRRQLTLTHSGFSYSSAVDAMTLEAFCDSPRADNTGLILVCCKSADTPGLLQQLKPWLARNPHCAMLSLQNGVTNEDHMLRALGAERTLSGLAVRIGAHVLAPGVVEATGRGEVELGAWPSAQANPAASLRAQAIFSLLQDAGIPVTLCADMRYAKWRKLVINNGVNPLSALTFLDTRSMTRDPVLRPLIHALMQETVTAANLAGVTMDTSVADDMLALITGFDAIKTSMLVDREKGRPLELDDICGPVIQQYEAAGRTAAHTALVRTLLQHNLSFP
ncbi:ketopantoate reductase family protein [Thalassolituus sp. LLYu03]|uniref:ketopantoate reductase family protein n=1 Tax=Thalassolituus sp. LLYu03 TaxID=3421656 RepID=UPI003D2C32B1